MESQRIGREIERLAFGACGLLLRRLFPISALAHPSRGR
jgi:hypothetical protein